MQWIEEMLGFSPDNGSGALELFLLCAASVVIVPIGAHVVLPRVREWRRRRGH
ncbi:MAG: hypothetical protein ABIP93_00220 [Gemmatimonadaceae bacterium]